jgi:hypothetical protein
MFSEKMKDGMELIISFSDPMPDASLAVDSFNLESV